MEFKVAGFELRQREVGPMLVSNTTRNQTPGMGGRMRPRRKLRGFSGLLLVLALVYGGIAVMNPWAVHMGGRWTPLLIWTGTGRLVTSSGTYPLLVTLSPSSHFSRLRLDGLRPTGGLSGWGWLCTSRGNILRLRLYGTMYGAWRSTDGALISLQMLERIQNFPTIQDGGSFELFGHWVGPQLVMDDRKEWSAPFRSEIRIKAASVTLKPGNESEFKAGCAATSE